MALLPVGTESELDVIGESDGGVAPGAFVRQVLSCMCTLSCSWDLASSHPIVRTVILDQSTAPLPRGLHLGMALYAGPHSRMSGPQLKLDPGAGTWAWLIEMPHPPFAFNMVLATCADEPFVGFDLGPLTLEHPDRRGAFTAELLVGFGWTRYPGDYRSSAALGWDEDEH